MTVILNSLALVLVGGTTAALFVAWSAATLGYPLGRDGSPSSG